MMSAPLSGRPFWGLLSILSILVLAWPGAVAAERAYALTPSGELVVFDTTTPGIVDGPYFLSGMYDGDIPVALDIRPLSGELYALTRSGVIYLVQPHASHAGWYAEIAGFAPPLPGLSVDIDFDPVNDQLRIISDGERYALWDPRTGQTVGPGSMPAMTRIVAFAFDSNHAGATRSQVFGIDEMDGLPGYDLEDSLLGLGATDGLLGQPDREIGPLGVDISGSAGLDIAPDGTAYASLRVGGVTGLYTVDLVTGQATFVGPIGGGTPLSGLAVQGPFAATMTALAANTLLTFNSAAPQTVMRTVPITGLQPGEVALSLALRPESGEFYAIGDTSQLYRVDVGTGAATAIGLPLPTPLSGITLAFDADAIEDRLRVIDGVRNLRLDPATADVAAIDMPLAPSTPLIAATYAPNIPGRNDYRGVPLPTTLFGIAAAGGAPARLVRIGGPDGTPSPRDGAVTTIGSLGFEIGPFAGFDVVAVDGAAYAALTAAGETSLYRIDLGTGAAVRVGPIGTGLGPVRGLVASTPGRARFSRPVYYATEHDGSVTITVVREGDTAGWLSVTHQEIAATASHQDFVSPRPWPRLGFAPGETTRTFVVPLIDDAIDEADETVVLTLGLLGPGGSVTAPATATLVILDDDNPAMPPSVAITGPTAYPEFFVRATAVTLTGTASGGTAGVSGVTWENDRGGAGTAEGTTDWKAVVPLVLGLNAITVRATTTAGDSALDTLWVHVSGTHTLAEGSTGTFFDTDLLIANPNAEALPVAITYQRANGAIVPRTRVLPPWSRATLSVDAEPGLEATTFAVTARPAPAAPPGLPLLVERTMRWGGGYGAHTERAAAGASTRWYFAEGAQGFFDTFLLLVNAIDAPNVARVHFLLEGGGEVARSYPIAPRKRVTIHAGGIAALAGRSFAIIVEFQFPGMAERAMYFGTPLFNGGHASAGIEAPSTTWVFAEGATGPFFTTFLLVANPGSSPVDVTFTYLPSLGGPVVRTRSIPARGRVSINVALEAESLGNAAVATRIQATAPIVAERSQYWPGPPSTWTDGHNSGGQIAAGLRWGFAEGRTGGPDRASTYILIANPGTVPARVTLQFLRESDRPVFRTFLVPPQRRLNVGVGPGTAVPELEDEAFGVVVTASAPVAVERALYSDAGGERWAAGTCAAAAPLP